MKRLSTWYFAPLPRARLVALRIAVGVYACAYVALRLPELARVAALPSAQFAPVGLARVLAAPLPPAVVIAIAAVTCAACAAFAAGIAYRAVAPAAALALAWTLGYRHAWGQIFHTDDLVVLHVAALACAPAGRSGAATAPPAAGDGWPIRLCAVITVATYVIAGTAKLRLAGGAWLGGDPLRAQLALDQLRKALVGAPGSSVATALVAHPASLAALAVATLAIELLAPVALWGGRWARGWIAAAWAFHLAVAIVMKIVFPYPLCGVAFAPSWLLGSARTGRAG